MPLVSIKSFAPQGMPCSGPRYLPCFSSRSSCCACARARSAQSVITQCNLGSSRCRRASDISVSSAQLTCCERISAASVGMSAYARSSSFGGRSAFGTGRTRGVILHSRTCMPGSSGSNANASASPFARGTPRTAAYPSRWSSSVRGISFSSDSLNSIPSTRPSAWMSSILVTGGFCGSCAEGIAGAALFGAGAGGVCNRTSASVSNSIPRVYGARLIAAKPVNTVPVQFFAGFRSVAGSCFAPRGNPQRIGLAPY